MNTGKIKKTFKTSGQEELLHKIFLFRYGRLKICPKCGRKTKFHKVKDRKSYICQYCGYTLNPLANTIFHKSHTPLIKWFMALDIYHSTKGGITINDLQKQLKVTRKTAWRIKHRIKKLYTGKTDPLYPYLQNWEI